MAKERDVKWAPKAAKRILAQRLEVGMSLALQYAVGQVRRLINPTQPYRITAKGTLVGLSPSKPGRPPKSLTRSLFLSISARVKADKRKIVGWYGASTPYARRLELGFVGIDSRGRKIHQEARPYLRPIIQMQKHKRRIMKAFRKGAERKVVKKS